MPKRRNTNKPEFNEEDFNKAIEEAGKLPSEIQEDEDFAEQESQPIAAVRKPKRTNRKVAWRVREESGRKNDSYQFRFNKSQRELLNYAKEESGKSFQKLIDDALWATLEKEYGTEVPVEE